MQIGEAVKVDEFKNRGSAAEGRGRCTREVTNELELKMFRFSLGETRMDKSGNECIRGVWR